MDPDGATVQLLTTGVCVCMYVFIYIYISLSLSLCELAQCIT